MQTPGEDRMPGPLEPRLRARLEPLARREHRLRLSLMLAGCWAITGLAGWGFMGLENLLGWSSWLALPLAGTLGLALSLLMIFRFARYSPDWRSLARQIESQYPDLDGRLLTAVQQRESGPEAGYLQQRVI